MYLSTSWYPCRKIKHFGSYGVRKRKAAPDIQEAAWHYHLALMLPQAGLAATAGPWGPVEHDLFQRTLASDKATL